MSIKIQNLSKVYGTQRAVDDISFEVAKGEIVGFLGPNGAGKSTTVKILAGIIQDYNGDVQVAGINLAENVLEVIQKLKTENIKTFAIEQVESAIFLQNFEVEQNQKYALVFGNEVFGVAQEAVALCDGAIEIPQLGTKHSLNISVSAGIVVWDLFKKLHFKK